MPVITDLHIKNFKCFEDFKVQGLKRITLIGGKNNVGKTSPIEAFYLSDIYNLSKFQFMEILNFRGVRDINLLDFDMLFTHWFYKYDSEKTILLQKNKTDQIEFSLVQTDRKFIPFSTNKTQKDSIIHFKDLKIKIHTEVAEGTLIYKIEDGLKFDVHLSRSNFKDQAHLLSVFTCTQQKVAEKLTPLIMTSRDDEVVGYLQLIDSKIKSLRVLPNTRGDQEIYIKYENIKPLILIHQMGNGILRWLDIVVSILQDNTKMLCIDEIENGFHYSIMPKVWEGLGRIAEERDIQIFATTHSYECIQSMVDGLEEVEGFQKKCCYMKMMKMRDKDGNETEELKSSVFSGIEIKDMLEDGWEMR